MALANASGHEAEVRLLGAFEIAHRGIPVEVPGDRLRVVLASLAWRSAGWSPPTR